MLKFQVFFFFGGGVCMKYMVFWGVPCQNRYFFYLFSFFFLEGEGTEQMLGPSLCVEENSEYPTGKIL